MPRVDRQKPPGVKGDEASSEPSTQRGDEISRVAISEGRVEDVEERSIEEEELELELTVSWAVDPCCIVIGVYGFP